MWAEVCSRQSKMGEEVSVMKGEKKKKSAPPCPTVQVSASDDVHQGCAPDAWNITAPHNEPNIEAAGEGYR